MITRTAFDVLLPVEKIHTVLEFGEELDNHTESDFHVKLYVISDFFVELWYQRTSIRLTRLVTLSSDEVADLYADTIDISDACSF
jgi:hypothetical protein